MTISVFSFPTVDAVSDLLFMHVGQNSQISQRVQQDLFNNAGGTAATGIQKLVQQVTLRLLTPRDGYRFEPLEGAQLMTDVIAGQLRTAEDARRAFANSRESILQQFARDESDYPLLSDEERLHDLNLINVSVQRDSLYLYVKIVSRAGRNSVFAVPLLLS